MFRCRYKMEYRLEILNTEKRKYKIYLKLFSVFLFFLCESIICIAISFEIDSLRNVAKQKSICNQFRQLQPAYRFLIDLINNLLHTDRDEVSFNMTNGSTCQFIG